MAESDEGLDSDNLNYSQLIPFINNLPVITTSEYVPFLINIFSNLLLSQNDFMCTIAPEYNQA